MKKYSILLFLSFLLVACSTDELTTTNSSTDAGNKENQVETNSLTEDEALKIATEGIINLLDATYPAEVGSYSLEDEVDYSYEQWEEIGKIQKESLLEFATEEYIATYIQVDYADCAQTCQIDPPIDIELSWNPTISIASDKAFSVKSIIRPFMNNYAFDYNSVEQTVDFVLEEGKWKVQYHTYQEKDMNLTSEDIETYLNKQGFTNVTIDETETTYEISGVNEKVYAFTDNDIGNPYVLVLRTGHVEYTGEYEDYYGDYSINNQEDYVEYNLFRDWSIYHDLLDLNDPQIASFYNVMMLLEEGRQEAYEDADEQHFETILSEQLYLQMELLEYVATGANEEIIRDAQNTWQEEYDYYFETILPDNIPNIDRLNAEAQIRHSNLYGLLITTIPE